MKLQNSIIIAALEKIPSVNFIHVAKFKDFSVIMTPKIGTRTIRDALIHEYGIKGDITQKRRRVKKYIHVYTKSSFLGYLQNKEEVCYLITRSPYDRFRSCWKQKLLEPEINYPYFIFYYPYIRPRMPLRRFIDIVSLIPIRLCEKHFTPQSYYIDNIEKLQCISLSMLDQLFKMKLGKAITRANETMTNDEKFCEKKYFYLKLGEKYHKDYEFYAKSQEADL